MHAPQVALLALAGLAHFASAAQSAPKPTTALVSFPESMLSNRYTTADNKFNGFYHYSREQCLNICGHVPGIGFYSHHVTSNTPLRLANSAVISCWCCVKDKNGDCFTNKNPFSAAKPWGDWTDATAQVVGKLQMKSIGCKVITPAQVKAAPVARLQITTAVPAPGKTIAMEWQGPESQIGGVFFAFFQDSKKTTKVVKLVNGACKFPTGMTGRIAITVSASANPKATSIYQIARTTITIGSTKRHRRDVTQKRL